MYPRQKKQNNFICNPENPWGPVCDSTLTHERYIINYKFIELQPDLFERNEEAFKTIQRLKKIFTQFKDKQN